MARRGSRFKPPELRGTLGTLLRTTIEQAGAVLERGAREGRARFDDLRADRRRQEALAELGEMVLGLIRQGEIDLGELPEARAIVAHLDELDAEEDPSERAPTRPRASSEEDGTVASGRWTPPRREGRRTTNVWRPPSVEEPVEPEPVAPPAPKRGGIQFGAVDDDEDLAAYMHPDDVPAKKE